MRRRGDEPLEPADPCAAARMDQIAGIDDRNFFPKAAVAAALPYGRTCIAELDRLLGSTGRFCPNRSGSIVIMVAEHGASPMTHDGDAT